MGRQVVVDQNTSILATNTLPRISFNTNKRIAGHGGGKESTHIELCIQQTQLCMRKLSNMGEVFGREHYDICINLAHSIWHVLELRQLMLEC